MISNDRQVQNDRYNLHWISRHTLLIFLIGILLGYGIAMLQSRTSKSNNNSADLGQNSHIQHVTEVAALTDSTEPAKKPSINDAVVRLELRDVIDGSIIQSLGIVTAQEYTLILPLPAVKHAREGTLINSRGHRFPLEEIIGESIDNGIVAVKSELSSGFTLQLSDEQGALYLGREFIALAAGDETSGWVDSLSFEKPNGAVTYLVRLQRPMEWQGGAMIDPVTKTLIGIAMAATNDPVVYEVIDAAAIQELIGSIPGRAPLTLAEYSKYYYEKIPTGMLERFQLLVNTEKWDEAIHLSDELLSQNPDLRDRILPHLEKAYLTLIRTSIDDNDIDKALVLLDDAKQKIEESPQRLLLRAEISERLGDLQGARDFLHQSLDADTSLAGTVIPRIRRLVIGDINEQGQHLSSAAIIDLLVDEIGRDPDYAVYYNLLGQQYFKLGNYREAVKNLDYAIQLDPAFAEESGKIITLAQQRLNTPGLIEVPLFSTGNVYYVAAKLNGLPRTFRFMLDTGASFTAVSNDVARYLGILVTDNSGTLVLSTANGVINAPLRKLQSLELNGAIVRDVDVVVLDTMNNFDGLIGLSYLNHFDIDINQNEQKLILVRR